MASAREGAAIETGTREVYLGLETEEEFMTGDDEDTAQLRREIREELGSTEPRISGMKPVTFGILAGLLISLPGFLLVYYVLDQNGLSDPGKLAAWLYNCVRGYCV
jgi:hypothetical protein